MERNKIVHENSLFSRVMGEANAQLSEKIDSVAARHIPLNANLEEHLASSEDIQYMYYTNADRIFVFLMESAKQISAEKFIYQLVWEPTKRNLQFQHIYVGESLRRKGIATYAKLITEQSAVRLGCKKITINDISTDAKSYWKQQQDYKVWYKSTENGNDILIMATKRI
jgi:hypothetical protein